MTLFCVVTCPERKLKRYSGEQSLSQAGAEASEPWNFPSRGDVERFQWNFTKGRSQSLLGRGDFSVVKSVKSCQSCRSRRRGLFFPLIKFSKRSGKNRSRTGRIESLEQLVSSMVGISGTHLSSCSKFKMKAIQQHEESANLSTAYLLALKMQDLRLGLNRKNEEITKACVLSSRH